MSDSAVKVGNLYRTTDKHEAGLGTHHTLTFVPGSVVRVVRVLRSLSYGGAVVAAEVVMGATTDSEKYRETPSSNAHRVFSKELKELGEHHEPLESD